MIYIFRGKAATGKTTLAKACNDQKGIPVISKDTFFDDLLLKGLSWKDANQVAYDTLADRIQAFHDLGHDLIVDIGLSHRPFFRNFLSKMKLEDVKYFLFDCEDKVWQERMRRRIEHPQGPNQTFKSVTEAKEHYLKYDINPIENEICLEGSRPLHELVDLVMKVNLT